MLSPKHFSRYRDLALLLTRYGLRDFTLQMEKAKVLAPIPEEDAPIESDVKARAEGFVRSLKEMGPTYVKFGQVLSTRPDIVPQEYIAALEQLQDSVESFPYAQVEEIVEQELGGRISKIFGSFETEPLAAASLAQVHRATLRDGREVVVKVQRPDILQTIIKDLEVFDQIADFLQKHSDVGRTMNLVGTVEQARITLMSELDYRQEAFNGALLRQNLAEFEEIYVPLVIEDLTTSKVLTMEMVRGKKVSNIRGLDLTEHDYRPLAAVLIRAYLKQIGVDGVWHSDPHPGNVFVQEDRLVLLDFGMVSRISDEFQDEVIKFLLAMSENRGEEVADICIRLGTPQEGFRRDDFVRDVTTLVTGFQARDVRRTNTGQLMFSVIGVANANKVQVPAELALLAKTLLHLDAITKILDPDFNAPEVIRNYSEELLVKKLKQKFQPRNLFGAFLDLNKVLVDLPRHSRDIVEQVANGRVTINLRMLEAEEMLKAAHKIANRITVGIVIAALVIASAMMMRVPSGIQFLGYPILAIIGFVGASIIAFYLVISTLIRDRRDREKAHEKAKR